MDLPAPLPLQRARFRVAGYAQAFPSAILKNSDLALQLGVDPEWIRARCGVHSRYVSGPGETTTTLGVRAARQALLNAPSFRPDCLVCATFTPDYPLCPCGPAMAHALELGPIPAFDLNAACSGGVLGLITALSFIAAGTAERVLLVASDTVTHHLADDDAHTRILFGDGAAAFLIEACPQGIALRSWVMGSDGAGAKLFHVPHGGSAAHWQAPGNGAGRSGLGTGPPGQHPHRRTTPGAHRNRAGEVDREYGGDRQYLLGVGIAGAWGLAGSQRDRGRRSRAFGRFWRGSYLGRRAVRMGRNCPSPAGESGVAPPSAAPTG
jgi:hypothetical protein